MKRILLMVILLSVPLCDQTPANTPAAPQSITVTIAKDGIDWANYLLVAVGVGGIAVAVWTLCYIRKQAIEMRALAAERCAIGGTVSHPLHTQALTNSPSQNTHNRNPTIQVRTPPSRGTVAAQPRGNAKIALVKEPHVMTDATGHMNRPGAGPLSSNMSIDGIPLNYWRIAR